MSINSIPTLIGSLSALAIGLFVYSKGSKSPINLSFGLFCLSLFGWLFGYTIVYSAKEVTLAMMGTRIACAFAAFTAPAFYHLVVSYLDKKNEQKFVCLSYIITLFFFFSFIFTNFLLTTPHRYSWGYYSHASTFHPLYLLMFFSIFTRGLYLLFISYLNRRKLSPIEATRIVYVFVAYLVALLGAVDYIQKYGIDIYPFGWLFEVGFVFIMAYAITKHHLLDIEVVIKRTVVYSTATALLTGLFVSLILVSNQIFRGLTGYSSIWPSIIGAFVIALIFQPLRELIQKAVDKIFFRARYNYQYILGKYSHALAQPMTDLDRFSRIAPYLLTKAMKLSGVSFMVLDREKHSFVVRAGEKETKGIEGLEVSEDSPLIQEILSRKRGISIEEMRYALRLGKDQRLESIISDMQRLKTVLIIPCVSESEYFKKPVLLSTINLGKKMSDENFSTEDIEFLRTLANQAAISIEYAFIMEELKRNQAAVVRSEKLAAIGTTTAGIAHELKNPLTYLNTLSQLMAKKWDDPEFKKSVADTLPAETQRMQMMVEGLLDYSREKEMQFKPVEIKEVVDKTLALLAYEIRKKSIEIKTDFSHQGVVSGDPNRLMQVFMNIVANAVQVMGAKGGEIIISTEEKADQVVVSIKDTGPGIAEENLKKIFDPFYSTKEGGTGLGLVITRKIVEEHKGSIEVESTPGQGTTFKISLPRA